MEGMTLAPYGSGSHKFWDLGLSMNILWDL